MTTVQNNQLDEANKNLLVFSSSGQSKELQKLIDEELININFQDEKGNTALHSACYFDELNIVKILVSHTNINISMMTNRKDSIFHLCANSNSLNCLEFLCNFIKSKKELEIILNSQNEWNETPLHLACASGHVEVVKILCQNGASTTMEDKWNRTALRVAFENGEKSTFENLEKFCEENIIKEAKEIKNEKIEIPERNQQKSIIEEFMNKSKNKIHHSNQLENLIKVTHTFDVKGKIINKIDKQQSEPIQKKISISKLFEYGSCPKDLNDLSNLIADETININGKDYYGWNALHKSLLWNKFEYIPLLLKEMSKESINEFGSEGQNALHILIQYSIEMNDETELKEFIKCKKVDLTIKDKNGLTPLEYIKLHQGNMTILSLFE